MYKLFFKIAVRFLFKNRLYSFINIAGLAIGIASFILIMLYVNYERSYDKFQGSNEIYRVFMDFREGDTYEPGDAQTSNLIGPTLTEEFPEVLDYARLYRFDKVTFKRGDKILEESLGSMADASSLKMFYYPLLLGNMDTALEEPNTIVLTESLAKKIFGDENPMYKTISAFYGEEVLLTVTGILKDIPKNTHMKNNFLISFKTLFSWDAFEGQQTLNWTQCNFFTYLKVGNNANYELLKSKVVASDFEEDEDERYNIEPLQDIHLYSNKPYEAEANGSITRVKFLTAIAFIILVLSWLNYVNLSTTKSLERAKEIGIRKVVGAQRKQLVVGSLTESILLNVIAIGIAILIVFASLTLYQNAIGREIQLQSAFLIELLPSIGVVVLGVIAAGIYPAILLSGYSPSKALKGKVRASAGGLNVRKGLIITQFMATIVLLIGTLVITKQINFLEKQPIGTNLERVVAFRGEILTKTSDSIVRSKYLALENELQGVSFIKSASRAQTFPGDGYDNLASFAGITYPNGFEESHSTFYNYRVQSGYFDLMDIKFLAGGTFVDNPSGQSFSIIINEHCMRKIQINSPEEAINKTVDFFGRTWTIVGVVENYHHFGLKTSVQPLIMLHRNDGVNNNLLVKFDETVASTSGYTNAISEVKKKWIKFFPESSFGYTFLDQKYAAQYKDDKQFGMAFRIFTLLAVFIACLGLFGLTSYTTIQRRKEIGVRKVNGATITQILSLLNKDFLKWLGLAFLIAVPISWYTMNNWLSNFAYKTSLSWWVFALAGIMVIIISLMTVSWQSFRAAIANPTEALRDE